MTTAKTIGLVIAGVVISVLLSVALKAGNDNLGGVYNQVTNYFRQGITVGDTGTKVAGVNFGSCVIRASSQTITATTTQTADCVGGNGTSAGTTALPGITLGDSIILTMGTNTPTTVGGIHILGASASTTAGYITVKLYNATGGTFTWTDTASSSFQYRAFR